MSIEAKKRITWSLWGLVVLATSALLFWDITVTIAKKLTAIATYGTTDTEWVVIDREVPPALLDPIVSSVPLQNSVVGICQSTDASLGGLAAPLGATLTYDQVDSITRLAVQRAGGLDEVVDPGDWVAIKPNILNFYGEDAFGYQTLIPGTSTDPRVVKSLIQQLVEEGDASRITISEGGDWHNLNDLPPSLQGIQTEDGWTAHWAHYGNLSYEDMVAEFDTLYPGITFDIVDMNYPPYTERLVPGGGLVASTYTIPDVLNCDVLIPVATMKTHNLARITCIHKHYIGVAPGVVYGTPAYHFGMNKLLLPHGDHIEKVVIDLFSYHPADFSLVECFWGMEREGPNAGTSIKRNVVLASRDPVALDAADAYVMGMNPWDIDYLHWSRNKGFGIYDFDYITVNGPSIDDVRHEFIKATRGPGYYLGRGNRIWLVNGTYPGTALDDEHLGAGIEATISPVPGQISQGEPWTVAQFTEVNDYCDLSTLFYSGPSNCVAYAFTRIVVDTAQTAYLRFGSDDGLKIWLNGSVIYNNPTSNSWSKVEDGVPVNLVAGVNRLLLKVSNVFGSYGFSFFTNESISDGDTPLGLEYRVTATPAPEIVLHSPPDSAAVADTAVDLVTVITDGDDDTLTVRLYGGSTPDADDLLYVETGVTSAAQISHHWDAPVLQVGPETRGLWHLNDNSGLTVADESGNGNTGTITGAAWTTAGRFGPGLEYTPGNMLDLGNDPSLNPQNEVTYEAWFRIEQIGDIQGLGAKIMGRDHYAFLLVRPDASLRWEAMRSGTVYTWPTADTPPGSIPMGEWVYVAGTVDSTGLMKAYVNGQMLASQNLAGSLNASGDLTVVGWWPDHLFDGTMDELRISDRALTESEIWANYRLGYTTYYWKVSADDGSNVTVSETRSLNVISPDPDVLPPSITLDTPGDGAQFPKGTLVDLAATVSDNGGGPLEVWIYGDTSATPTDLLYHAGGLSNPADVLSTWSGGQGEFAATSSTVALWHFNENAGSVAVDASGNLHDGNVQNAIWTGGRFASGLTFGGDDRVEIPDDPAWNTPQVTVQAWANASAFSSGYNVIVSKGSYPSPVDLGYALAVHNGRVVFLIGNSDGSGWAVLLDAMGGTTLSSGTWYHLAATYDQAEVRLYVNGMLDTNGTANPYVHAGGTHPSAGPIDIGSSFQQSTSDSWNGVIDEVRISNVALSESEVQSVYTLAAGRYYWYVTASDTTGNSSTSPTRFFDVAALDVPALLSPADEAVVADDTPTLVWNLTAGPGGTYALQQATDSLFVFAVTDTLPDTTYTVPAPLAEGDYYWRVNAIDVAGNESGYQVDPFKFTVDLGALAVPSLLVPVDSSYTSDSTPTFNWTSIIAAQAGASGSGRDGDVSASAEASADVAYTLQYGIDPAFADAISIEDLPDVTYTVPDSLALDPKVTYYWRVEAVDQADNHSGYPSHAFQFGIFVMGDVNGSGQVTSADIIYMVDFNFRGGPDLIPCMAAGDVNCDGVVTTADIIQMVNHIFKGGTPPCNVGDLLEASTWSCP